MSEDEDLSYSRRSYTPNSQSLTALAATELVLKEMTLLYSRPRQVKTDQDAAAYQSLIAQAVLEQTHDAAAIKTGWEAFKTAHLSGFWPVPGVLCEHIRTAKRDRTEYASLPRPLPVEPPSRWNEVVTPEIRERTMEAIRQAEIMASSPNPAERVTGKMLAKLGYSIIERNQVTG